MTTTAYRPDEAWALRMDTVDPLSRFRARFHVPPGPDGRPATYFCGNSLGLMPREARRLVEQELADWAGLAVEGHFRGRTPWFSYHERVREPMARLVGAAPGEVTAMNGLTVNLHLMMASFYRPTAARWRVLMEDAAFPSDTYAVASQIAWHGRDPERGILRVSPREGEHAIRPEDVEETLEREGDSIALVLFAGVHYQTGQRFDLKRIADAARRRGCAVGFDLAHAAGNVPLSLHDDGPDFAVWCTYKYLNAGPGAVAGAFVHERHAGDRTLPRLAGWWGNDPHTRFRNFLERRFVPRDGADGWQLSNPPILALAPLRASLALFEEAGMPALRAKSERLTGYLEYLVDRLRSPRVEILTPRDPAQRGCQLSLRIRDGARETFRALEASGVIGDFREPDVIRLAPVPLYNTFAEVWRVGGVLERLLR